ncbi:hypothetical protein CEUSTIGMA_g6352.t1 [Chlamydomonas eustigma]|uniref:RING-type domain-containing protein n=1 Tax=Chlamydomonas eustigma TaxID=1157962 RepID=A0A250X750_9CHLO|nr:hypothetical protein CEUSTIGMA_g6352.t1 [Chlamydomonas eustigma]|eukprot:GAX78913.1 hypothetical protein CEUSTIGMA_g6352.t1 [Chlamydomonas eustigma]
MPGQVPSNQEEPDAQQNPRSSLSINNPRLVLSGLSASAGYIHSRTLRHHAYPNKVGQAMQDSLKDQPGVPASSAAADLSLVWASSTDTSMSAAAPPSSVIAASISKTSGGVGDWVPEEQQQQQEVEEVSSCGVCLDDKGEIVATKPCGHKMCVDCAMELLKLHAYDPSPCPFCRSIIRGFMG